MGSDDPIKVLENLQMDEKKFVDLLGNIIGEAQHLQNNPPTLIPKEDRAVRHVLDVLEPLSEEHGGPLKLNHKSYVEGRGNLIVEYPGTVEKKVVSFVGSHLDVVPANKEDWDFDPFTLTRDGDKLRGRGTTDCLGHVALVTELFRQLAEKKLKLKSSVIAVFIANEENSTTLGVGIDALVKDGLLDDLKNGPLFWIDVADMQPCIGTGGMLVWKLKAEGKLFHSGLPHKAINPLEMIQEAFKVIQDKFYTDFPPTEKEKEYGFATPSTMKPTQWSYPGGGVNQIPAEAEIRGDCRITPFYSVEEVEKKIRGYVQHINDHIEELGTRGPVSKYVLPEEGLRGKLKIEFDEIKTSGIACNIKSTGYKALCDATAKVLGQVKPYSITGSLPLIYELQQEGFDIQCAGYGRMETYHANNEYAHLSDFKKGFQILAHCISLLEN
ncbi:hypothetical protein R1flu_010601 [Riccia fluitans]|uniref:Peptidase M20 dimerisation domain-containing protein n=1 Tax=Riccia fluitans TaxID=41844 RepID=A0ABD1Z6H9_9MARC